MSLKIMIRLSELETRASKLTSDMIVIERKLDNLMLKTPHHPDIATLSSILRSCRRERWENKKEMHVLQTEISIGGNHAPVN